MVSSISVSRAVLVSTCLLSTVLAQSQAQEHEIAWLRDTQREYSTSFSKLETAEDTEEETSKLLVSAGNDNDVTVTDASISPEAQKRDPKRRPNNSLNNGTNSTQDDESGAGKCNISGPLSIVAGLAIMAVILQL
ncbi:hypothetical protein F4677DRAFT_342475 [Hypoxylon crocopeplum]|nr:hypothetical protein F4677DRAFT_342475 [Hypoxylon crocopeplum]